jgi:flavorubredoxin
MPLITHINLDYSRPIKLAEEVYWVGFHDPQTNAPTNPYVIVDGNEAVVLDGGSRSAFPSVMMKILQTGIAPSSIVALIYQNYDPRLCGSMPHLESIIDRPDLKVISDRANRMFIQHYAVAASFLSLHDVAHEFRFSSGRTLRFINTPYAHTAGSFITFDDKTGILFTSDLFSGYSSEDDLFMHLGQSCRSCGEPGDTERCPIGRPLCPIDSILSFHRDIMTSERALKLALERVSKIPFTIIAPQHGGIIHEPEDVINLCERLATLRGVGIDGISGDRAFAELGNISPIIERLGRL